ncbi:hypothetical protein [Lignipirellula cremea]|uniref:Uncharacterized protein n=1 Tax=Lignipirellula cremea TaxID=2528010 RepID=A0A518E2J8_9BACT|nr:hypothetical protein [Lignipirellula cremea]QDU98292.1 hypothetical protein Pla8534_61540 [Lignipirellula cremea]
MTTPAWKKNLFVGSLLLACTICGTLASEIVCRLAAPPSAQAGDVVQPAVEQLADQTVEGR